jgi:hypothetical protein
MKTHSDNIKVTAGKLIVQNFNWFPDERLSEFNKSNFLEIARRIYEIQNDNLKREMEYLIEERGMEKLSLLTLNTPWITLVDRNRYLLYSGQIFWGGKVFKQGFVFEFDENQDLILEGKNNVEKITVLPVEWRDVEYDYYHGSQDPTEVTDIVRKELGVSNFSLDIPEDAPDEYVDLGPAKVELKSFYAPNLPLYRNVPERILIPSTNYVDEKGMSNNEYAIGEIDKLKERFYDEYFVEIIDRSSLFGYILLEFENFMEHLGYLKYDGHDKLMSKMPQGSITAFNKDTFDFSVKDVMVNYKSAVSCIKDLEKVLKENLYIFGKGDWEEEVDFDGMDLEDLEEVDGDE